MSKTKHLTAPLHKEDIASLHAGDSVLLSGVIYTARDKAHQKLVALIEAGMPLPVDLEGQVIYYAGPTPAKPGAVIGSIGPTTSGRMDGFAPTLLRKAGLAGMIGKGPRDASVRKAIEETGSVYFVAIGGTGARIANSVVAAEVVAFEELGTEAIRRLEINDFPLIVACDIFGGNLFESGPATYRTLS